MAEEQEHEVFNIKDNPVPEGAEWHSTGDKAFYEASKEVGDHVDYIIVDGIYHLGSEIDVDDDE